MKRRYFVTVFVAAAVLASCAPPIGMLGGSSAKRGNRTMWVIPNRVLYDEEHSNVFYRDLDFRIYYMENGVVENINPMDPGVTVRIEYRSLSTVEQAGGWNVETSHKFDKPGRYEVFVKFEKDNDSHSDLYSVEVRGYGTNTDPAGEQFGTHIIWW